MVSNRHRRTLVTRRVLHVGNVSDRVAHPAMFQAVQAKALALRQNAVLNGTGEPSGIAYQATCGINV